MTVGKEVGKIPILVPCYFFHLPLQGKITPGGEGGGEEGGEREKGERDREEGGEREKERRERRELENMMERFALILFFCFQQYCQFFYCRPYTVEVRV